MPITEDREYRTMPVMAGAEDRAAQLIDSDYYVEGYATTFNQRYLLFKDRDGEYYEVVDGRAFDNTDMSDVIFLHNHTGKCFARNKMKPGKDPTMILEVRESGLFVAADLGTIAEGREEHHAITSGLVYQMSFAFAVDDDEIEELEPGKYLRTIKSIRKVYDVSSVDLPANPYTVVDSVARSAFEGFIRDREEERLRAEAEAAARKAAINKIKVLTEV